MGSATEKGKFRSYKMLLRPQFFLLYGKQVDMEPEMNYGVISP